MTRSSTRGRRSHKRHVYWIPTTFNQGASVNTLQTLEFLEPYTAGVNAAYLGHITLLQNPNPTPASGGLGAATSSVFAAAAAAEPDLRIERIVGRILLNVVKQRDEDDTHALPRSYNGTITTDEAVTDCVRFAFGFRMFPLDETNSSPFIGPGDYNVNQLSMNPPGADRQSRIFHVEELVYSHAQTDSELGEVGLTNQPVNTLVSGMQSHTDPLWVDIRPKMPLMKGQALQLEVGCMNLDIRGTASPILSQGLYFGVQPLLRILVSRTMGRF